jgi:hypothetical protein
VVTIQSSLFLVILWPESGNRLRDRDPGGVVLNRNVTCR